MVKRYNLQSEEVAWITGSDVNFCAQAFPTVDYDHPDAPILTVLGAVLRNGYLHSAIREKGGAYGSGAQQDSASRSFRFFHTGIQTVKKLLTPLMALLNGH